MDFMSRGRTSVNMPAGSAPAPHHPGHKPPRGGWIGRIMRIEIFTVIVGSAILLAAVALFLGLSGGVANEAKKVNNKEYQAVFLNNGQVYFGKVRSLNSKYIDLTNIFYIENSTPAANGTTSAQNTNYTLRKLGVNELHQPEDEMVINRDQVTFWENLKDSSQVVTKINEYYKNPNGSGTTTPSSSTTPSTTTPTTTTPTTGR